ncbi:MAG TPA: NAD(P)/FAD-dependent oxidoreductase [Gemmatimonadaceae bacterium]|nr:NAD(P)/FAD-dependent oxidoreductase [Gemmatimonadaceae bacterium]
MVIIGGGFGGLYAARTLAKAPVDVTVIDRTNHHVFQPLLYQVATAVLAPSDIASPIRFLLRRQKNTTVLLAEARAIDVERRIVFVDDERREIPYDFLILATGARHAYFGHDEWEPFAPGLKSIQDARELRRRFLLAFEMAEKTDDEAERAAFLTFVTVGGGPTGVELAGMLPIARKGMRRDFRRADTANTRVILLEAGPRLLPAFPENLSARAKRDLESLGVEVRTDARVTDVTPNGVAIGEEWIPARTVFWAAGNAASPLGRQLGVPVDRVGRVPVLPDLSIPGRPEVFVIGDLSVSLRPDGTPVPGVAPAAMQQGRAAAQNIQRTLRGERRAPFRYRNKGDLATIGRHRAIGDFGKFHVTGFIAWWFWLLVHIMYLAGFRNRASVLLEWAYAYFTYERGVRLIPEPAPRATVPNESPEEARPREASRV